MSKTNKRQTLRLRLMAVRATHVSVAAAVGNVLRFKTKRRRNVDSVARYVVCVMALERAASKEPAFGHNRIATAPTVRGAATIRARVRMGSLPMRAATTVSTCTPTSGGGSCGTGCGPGNCKGCCTAGSCLLGQSDASCGNQGQACAACQIGAYCEVLGPSIGGVCHTPCSPMSCKGCCSGDVCAVGTQDIACGVGGAACVDCTPNGCDAGACVLP
jgi:hypothetical protein